MELLSFPNGARFSLATDTDALDFQAVGTPFIPEIQVRFKCCSLTWAGTTWRTILYPERLRKIQKESRIGIGKGDRSSSILAILFPM